MHEWSLLIYTLLMQLCVGVYLVQEILRYTVSMEQPDDTDFFFHHNIPDGWLRIPVRHNILNNPMFRDIGQVCLLRILFTNWNIKKGTPY